jgi:RNA methyltransferase, TrmH family
VRRLRRLLLKRSARWAERVFVAEGTELVRTALAAGAPVEAMFVAAGAGAQRAVAEAEAEAHARGARIFDLAPGVLERVASTVAPQPVMAIVGMVDLPLDRLPTHELVVVCVDVRDPGNAGTVLRSADAAGVDAVVFCGDTVDPYNAKTVRASAGSLFHIPLSVGGDPGSVLDLLGARGMRRLGTSVHEGLDYTSMTWDHPTALVLGNEASGLSSQLEPHLDALAHIPMAGRAESLNVGVACAVLCFEALRRRRTAES